MVEDRAGLRAQHGSRETAGRREEGGDPDADAHEVLEVHVRVFTAPLEAVVEHAVRLDLD